MMVQVWAANETSLPPKGRPKGPSYSRENIKLHGPVPNASPRGPVGSWGAFLESSPSFGIRHPVLEISHALARRSQRVHVALESRPRGPPSLNQTKGNPRQFSGFGIRAGLPLSYHPLVVVMPLRSVPVFPILAALGTFGCAFFSDHPDPEQARLGEWIDDEKVAAHLVEHGSLPPLLREPLGRKVTDESEFWTRDEPPPPDTHLFYCTIYYTPRESGFTAEGGFDMTPETRSGLGGRKYPRDFPASSWQTGKLPGGGLSRGSFRKCL